MPEKRMISSEMSPLRASLAAEFPLIHMAGDPDKDNLLPISGQFHV